MTTIDKSATRKLKTVVVGAGMAGILAAIRLKERGEDFVVLEKAARIGGTWRENRYPGLTCDVPAHAYTYSFEPNPDWQAFYANGSDIQAYFEMVTDKYGIRSSIRFQSEVTDMKWDGDTHRWTVYIAGNEAIEADAVIVASGVLHHPKMPDIAGLESFGGTTVHSARWDDATPIDGKRVGLIGNGSTGVQILTAINRRVEKIVHFQRSPQWIMSVPQFAYTDEERAAFRSDPTLIDAIRYGDDYLGAVMRFTEGVTDIGGPRMAEIETYALENLEQSVRDPELREKLRPQYRAACKRLIYSWAYYEEVQNPNVFVEIGGIERIQPSGIRMVGGTFHELDTLILATGFHADRFIRPAGVTGENGQTLDDAWKVRASAYYAVTIPGFPNFFMLNGPTGPVGNFSLIDIAEFQWAYIDQLMDLLRTGDARAVAPTAAAHADYEERRIAAAKTTIFGSGCTSWYLDPTGVPSTWPWSYETFVEAMKGPRLEDFSLAA